MNGLIELDRPEKSYRINLVSTISELILRIVQINKITLNLHLLRQLED